MEYSTRRLPGRNFLSHVLLGFTAGAILSVSVFTPLKPDHGTPDRSDNLSDPSEASSRTPRILCLILTQPSTSSRAADVRLTWAKRCDRFLFIGSSNDSSLSLIDAGLEEGRKVLWGKTKFAFRYAYERFLDQFDWFFKGDDETYVIVENLRKFLTDYSPSTPLYFGSRLQITEGSENISVLEYMSGGAGYVLSREAVGLLVRDGIMKNACRSDNNGYEDLEMGRCLRKVGIEASGSRDGFGRGRFFVFPPWYHTRPNHMLDDIWYPRYYKFPEEDGTECCSDTAVSFHNIPNMQVLDYLIYHLNPISTT